MAKNLKGKIRPVAGNSLENPSPAGKYGKRDGVGKGVESYGLGEKGGYDKLGEDGQDHPYNGPITQHEEYAITGHVKFNEDFGVLKHDHKNRPHSEVQTSRKAALRDSQRAHPRPKGYHEHPDHGPTGHDGP